jgi:hypothetical protein
LYKALLAWTIGYDGYVNIYFHPWEFADLSTPKYNLPRFIVRNSGDAMKERFFKLIIWMKEKGYHFVTLNDFVTRDPRSIF